MGARELHRQRAESSLPERTPAAPPVAGARRGRARYARGHMHPIALRGEFVGGPSVLRAGRARGPICAGPQRWPGLTWRAANVLLYSCSLQWGRASDRRVQVSRRPRHEASEPRGGRSIGHRIRCITDTTTCDAARRGPHPPGRQLRGTPLQPSLDAAARCARCRIAL